VDTGDLLYSRAPAQGPNAQKMGELKGNLFMKTYNLMGYDAFTPGELDFSLGVGPVIQMSKQANFPFLAANLMDRKSKKPVFKPYIIKEVLGVKIGLLGLISNQLPLAGPPAERGKYYLADPIETAKKIVPQLKKKCQIIVALAHMGPDEQQKLAQACPRIFFILDGHNPNLELTPTKAHNSQIFNAGSRGEQLGQVEFLSEGRDLLARYQIISLTARYADHPRALELLNQYKSSLRELLQPPLQTGHLKGPSVVTPETSTLLAAPFVGESVCLPCHQTQYKSWLETPHARAYQTLIQQNKSSDPGCLSCHTTGFGEARKDPAANFQNVQCEACHGPGDSHPEPRKILSKIGEDQCLKCHNTANSPNFNYATYLRKVRHPGARD
jgi:predicted CXXCH cytochrome family protein